MCLQCFVALSTMVPGTSYSNIFVRISVGYTRIAGNGFYATGLCSCTLNILLLIVLALTITR